MATKKNTKTKKTAQKKNTFSDTLLTVMVVAVTLSSVLLTLSMLISTIKWVR